MGKFQFINIEPKLDEKILELIKRRRRQILLHSCIYYQLGTSLITDATYDKWSYELRDLQKKYPYESKKVEFYEYFKDWDGTTGFKLPYKLFLNRAYQLVEYCKTLGEENAEDRD